jgi:hypothetical protein
VKYKHGAVETKEEVHACEELKHRGSQDIFFKGAGDPENLLTDLRLSHLRMLFTGRRRVMGPYIETKMGPYLKTNIIVGTKIWHIRLLLHKNKKFWEELIAYFP